MLTTVFLHIRVVLNNNNIQSVNFFFRIDLEMSPFIHLSLLDLPVQAFKSFTLISFFKDKWINSRSAKFEFYVRILLFCISGPIVFTFSHIPPKPERYKSSRYQKNHSGSLIGILIFGKNARVAKILINLVRGMCLCDDLCKDYIYGLVPFYLIQKRFFGNNFMEVSKAKTKKLTEIFPNPSLQNYSCHIRKLESVSKFIGPQNKTFKLPILRTKTGERVFS